MPVSSAVAQIALLRQHVAHRSRLHRRQFLLVDGSADRLHHLGFAAASQDQFGLLDGSWKVGPRGRRIEANWTAQLWIPKVRIIYRRSPGTFHDAHKTI